MRIGFKLTVQIKVLPRQGEEMTSPCDFVYLLKNITPFFVYMIHTMQDVLVACKLKYRE